MQPQFTSEAVPLKCRINFNVKIKNPAHSFSKLSSLVIFRLIILTTYSLLLLWYPGVGNEKLHSSWKIISCKLSNKVSYLLSMREKWINKASSSKLCTEHSSEYTVLSSRSSLCGLHQHESVIHVICCGNSSNTSVLSGLYIIFCGSSSEDLMTMKICVVLCTYINIVFIRSIVCNAERIHFYTRAVFSNFFVLCTLKAPSVKIQKCVSFHKYYTEYHLTWIYLQWSLTT